MELGVFRFADEVKDILVERKEQLNKAAEDIEGVFNEILILNNLSQNNVSSRVKGEGSLKEKILRNNYFKKYDSPQSVIDNLSDLIGVRIECRFIQDEKKIYKILKKHFTKVDSDGFYYNGLNPKLKLELGGKQPQEQKNGFKIYRIDGLYVTEYFKVNFELQIKSLVNVFWSEIEHKVIYKNNNYMVWNDFFKELMGSIKKNLALIDNQLQTVYNQFNELNDPGMDGRKNQLELMLSKMIYEIYSNKMKSSIGIIVDFKNACDTIMKYIFRTRGAYDINEYNEVVLRMFSRLNEISKNKVDFNSELCFERECILEGEFATRFGNNLLEVINEDFQWNLFFRILFEIEEGSNAEDFETFIDFIQERFNGDNYEFLQINFSEDDLKLIKEDLMRVLSKEFSRNRSIEFIYDNMIERINRATRKACKHIALNVREIEQWQRDKEIYLKIYGYKVRSLFNDKIPVAEVKEFISYVYMGKTELKLSPAVMDYLYSFDDSDFINADTVVKFFRTGKK